VFLSFVIYRKFVGGVGFFCRFFSLADVYCFMLYYILNKFSLVYLPVSILVCVVDFIGGCFFMRFSFMVWFLSFVHLVKSFELFWLVCLVSGDLMFRVLSSGHFGREWCKITLTF